MNANSSTRAGFSGSSNATCSVESAIATGTQRYMRAVLPGIALSSCGEKSRSFSEITSAPRWLATTCRIESMSMIPKSCRIWIMEVPARLCSATTSSYCRSSIRFCSLINASNGFWISSAILQSNHSTKSTGRRRRRGVHAGGLGQFQFLELRLDRHRVLRLGNHFLARDHAGQIFFNQERIQRHHAVLRAGLDVRLNAERFIVANQRGDRRRVDHDFKNGHAARLVDARDQELRDHALQYRGKLDANHFLLVHRKRVRQTIDRLGCAGRMQRAENQ